MEEHLSIHKASIHTQASIFDMQALNTLTHFVSGLIFIILLLGLQSSLNSFQYIKDDMSSLIWAHGENHYFKTSTFPFLFLLKRKTLFHFILK